MRTARRSGCLIGDVCLGCLPGGCLPRGCLPRGSVSARGVSSQGGCLPKGRCLSRGGVSAQGDVHLPLVDRSLDTRLWKHYLSATSFADGKYSKRLSVAGVRLSGLLLNIISIPIEDFFLRSDGCIHESKNAHTYWLHFFIFKNKFKHKFSTWHPVTDSWSPRWWAACKSYQPLIHLMTLST